MDAARGGRGPGASLPEGLRELLLRRIEALVPEARRVLEAASVVGEVFAVAAVAAGVQSPIEDVEAVCDGLAAQRHFLDDTGWTVWPDGTRSGSYRFQHALYRQVLYECLGTMRCVQLHQRIGARLEAGYGAQAGEVAAQIAVHFERGGEIRGPSNIGSRPAIMRRGGMPMPKPSPHCRTGLALLALLPESSERTQRELALQLILGELLMVAKGMASLEAGEAYSRAYTLCQQVGEIPPALPGALGPHRVS